MLTIPATTGGRTRMVSFRRGEYIIEGGSRQGSMDGGVPHLHQGRAQGLAYVLSKVGREPTDQFPGHRIGAEGEQRQMICSFRWSCSPRRRRTCHILLVDGGRLA